MFVHIFTYTRWMRGRKRERERERETQTESHVYNTSLDPGRIEEGRIKTPWAAPQICHPEVTRGPKHHKSRRILFWFQGQRRRGIPETIVCRILMFVWSPGALVTTCSTEPCLGPIIPYILYTIYCIYYMYYIHTYIYICIIWSSLFFWL